MIGAALLSVIAQEANRAKIRPQDVFKALTYTGDGTDRTVNNGLDLSEAGSMVWSSPRNGTYDQFWASNGAEFSPNVAEANGYAGFWGARPSAGGFDLRGSGPYNETGVPYMSWSFKRRARFFTSLLYTGDGVSGRTVAHDLGVEPGLVVIKRVDAANNWVARHRSITAGHYLQLNANSASAADTTRFNAAPTVTQITLGSSGDVNASGAAYIAYLFAHEPSLIQCGSVAVGAGGTGSVTLGWEPQFLLIKANLSAENWNVVDTARGWGTGSPKTIRLNGGGTEYDTDSGATKTTTGFTLAGLAEGNHLYMAIRKDI